MKRITGWTVGVLALTLLVALTGCGGGDDGDDAAAAAPATEKSSSAVQEELEEKLAKLEPAETTRYVGEVEGTDAFLGVEERAGVVTAYICDSADLAVWLSGKTSGDDFAAKQGPASLTASLKSGELTGTVTLPDGSVHGFEAVEAETPAGLFQARAVEGSDLVRAGWVVLPSGEQRGNAKKGNTVRPVEQLSPDVIVRVGGSGATPVVPPPGPVTNKATYCQTLRTLFSQITAIRDDRLRSGQDTTDQDVAISWLVGEIQDQNCAFSAQ